MKKKLILMLALTIIACCLFALGVNAAATNEFGTVETNDTIDLTGMAEDDDVYVVLYDGAEYHTYPSRYIVTNANELTFNFEKIKAFGKEYDVTSIIRLQVPSHVLTFTSAFAYGKNPNIVEVSFPSDSSLKRFSYGTFETCEKLEKINIPATTTELGGHMFNGCSALTDVTFDAGFSMTSLANSMFKACSSLKTIVIPNSVTELKGGTFNNCTSIEKVVLGANLAKMGGDEFACAGSGTKAVKLYVPASFFASEETIPSRVYTWDTNHMKNVTYYFTGTKAQAEAIISKAEFANIKNAKVVAWDVAKGENHADYVVPGSNVFVYGYSACDAFNNGIHTVDEEKSNDCVKVCSNCGKITVEHVETENVSISISYADYTKNGTKTTKCLNEGCTNNTAPVVENTVPALFTCLGYSAKIGGTKITVGYSVDQASVEAYETSAGKTLKYGVVAYVPNATDNDADNAPINNDLTLKNPERTIFAEVESNTYSGFNFILNGFDEESYGLELIMSAFVYDGEKVYYLGANGQSEVGELITFNDKITQE